MRGCDEDDWPTLPPSEPPELTVEVTDPQVIGVLFDVDGDPLILVYDRSVVPFGFQRSEL